MNTVRIDCGCGDKGCTEYLEIKDDPENRLHILFAIGKKGELYSPFISLDREDVEVIIKSFKLKYKGL